MLQQTQVKTVIAYWERWMQALPDARSLSRAPLDRVLKLWEGLGYYTRARNMQKAAQAVVREHGGEFPRSFNDVLALPGIGRYTAGAICSIAFHDPRPILDGNVIRVLTRLFGIGGDPRTRPVNEHLWQLAEALVEAAGPRQCSALNQSLMELGALLCTPRQPQCDACPVRTRCVAYRAGQVGELPQLARRAAATSLRVMAFVAERNGRYLVRQRPVGVLNSQLWEFPNIEAAQPNGAAEKTIATVLGFKPRSIAPLGTVKHSITRYRITLEASRVTGGGPPVDRSPAMRWVTIAELDALALTSAHRKVFNLLTRELRLSPMGRSA